MPRHASEIVFVGSLILVAFIVAIVNTWYLAAAAIVLFALFGGGVWIILVARVDGQPSYEDQERSENPRSKHPSVP
ncbi:MAG TPA: hypothetical protein VL137_04190, partial [Polyangiaceae bacterium]|nr:hypothetical protein [Polyangiaceae bacterium]